MMALQHCTDIHVEAVGGIAGDMLLGALIDLGANALTIQETFDSFGIGALRLNVTTVEIHGLQARYVQSIATEQTKNQSDKAQQHHHHLADVVAHIKSATLSHWARDVALRIFHILAEAEAVVHGATVGQVHLHEVGALDSVMDVVGIAVALDTLGRPRIRATPLPSGTGQVMTSHGWLDCPVPAVAEVARRFNVPMVACNIEGETITPTGISVLAALCEGYGDGTLGKWVGNGAGTRRFTSHANVVRVHAN